MSNGQNEFEIITKTQAAAFEPKEKRQVQVGFMVLTPRIFRKNAPCFDMEPANRCPYKVQVFNPKSISS